MTTGSYNGIHLAGLASAVALYAGILGYLQIQGTESLDSARHGVAVNQQLQQDLERRGSESATAENSDEQTGSSALADAQIVRPLGGGIFATADGESTAQPADSGNEQSLEKAPVAESGSNATAAAPADTGPTATAPATAVAYASPVYYAYPAVDQYGFYTSYSPSADYAGYGQYDQYGRGNGRGQGRGRGNWDGDGEFSFSMRFVSRLRADADVDADSDWNAESDARAWQDAQQRLWWQQYQAAQAYSANR